MIVLLSYIYSFIIFKFLYCMVFLKPLTLSSSEAGQTETLNPGLHERCVHVRRITKEYTIE